MQGTHSNQYRQTTTTSEDLLGQRAIKQQQPAHKQGMRRSACLRVLERERKCLREGEGVKARAGVKAELSSKQSQTPPPPQSQLRSTESSGVGEDAVTTFHE